MSGLIAELHNALEMNHPVIYLNIWYFKCLCQLSGTRRKCQSDVLLTFYGRPQSLTFQSGNSEAPTVLNSKVDDKTISTFFEDFNISVERVEVKNDEIKMLFKLGKRTAAIKLDQVYTNMYLSTMKLLKLVMLITPSTANAEGFSVPMLLCTKQGKQ